MVPEQVMVNVLKKCKEKMEGKITPLAIIRIEKPNQEENTAHEEGILRVRTLGLCSWFCHSTLWGLEQVPPPPRATASSQREGLGHSLRFLQLPHLVIHAVHDPGPASSHTQPGPLETGHSHCPGAWMT